MSGDRAVVTLRYPRGRTSDRSQGMTIRAALEAAKQKRGRRVGALRRSGQSSHGCTIGKPWSQTADRLGRMYATFLFSSPCWPEGSTDTPPGESSRARDPVIHVAHPGRICITLACMSQIKMAKPSGWCSQHRQMFTECDPDSRHSTSLRASSKA